MKMKAFDEVFVVKTKYGTKVKTDEYRGKGRNIIIDQGQKLVAGYTNLEDGIFDDVPAIIFGDHTRIIKYVERPFFLGADGIKVLKSKIANAKYKYLYYALKSAKIPNTGYNRHFKWLREVNIRYPSVEEQKKIVSILDKVSCIIENRKVELEKLDDLIKARFVEMFGDPVLNPFGWEQTTLKDIAVGKLSYGSGSSATVYDGECRYVRITDITDSGELNDDIKSPDKYEEKYLLHDGDILFARSGATIGKTFRYSEKKHKKSIYAGYLIRLIPDKEKVLADYVFYYTKTEYYSTFVKKAQKAVAQPNINAQEYGNLIICLPPIHLQEEFVTFVQQVNKYKFASFLPNPSISQQTCIF